MFLFCAKIKCLLSDRGFSVESLISGGLDVSVYGVFDKEIQKNGELNYHLYLNWI